MNERVSAHHLELHMLRALDLKLVLGWLREDQLGARESRQRYEHLV